MPKGSQAIVFDDNNKKLFCEGKPVETGSLEALFDTAFDGSLRRGYNLWGINPCQNVVYAGKGKFNYRDDLALVPGYMFGFIVLNEEARFTKFGARKDFNLKGRS